MILPPDFKQCRTCKGLLPDDRDHYSQHRHRDGRIVTDTECRPCSAARSRERYHRNMEDPYLRKLEQAARREWNRRNPRKVKAMAERKRTTRAEHYAKRTATPEQREAILDAQRIAYALRKEREGRTTRPLPSRKGSTGLYSRSLRVAEHFDPEPFRRWVTRTYPDTPLPDLAKVLGVNDRTLTAVMTGEMLTVSVRFVDRAFVSIGRPDLLNTMYPLEG
jgi:hypothetical protein